MSASLSQDDKEYVALLVGKVIKDCVPKIVAASIELHSAKCPVRKFLSGAAILGAVVGGFFVGLATLVARYVAHVNGLQ